MNATSRLLPILATLTAASLLSAQADGFAHRGSIFVNTTKDGADLPAEVSIENFPLLVRLDRDWFDFREAKSAGEDVRFSTAKGTSLAYQIEHWDHERGTASIWVRVPKIRGNERLELCMHWGNATAASQSNGSAVFAADNGYCSVLHLDASLRDETGLLQPKNEGTTSTHGVIGAARRLERGQGIHGGEHVIGYPFGDAPFTTEAWFRTECAGAQIAYWGRYATRLNGKTGDGNECEIWLGSPATLNWSSDGPGGVRSTTMATMRRWTHVAATYENGSSKLFVDGQLVASREHKAAMSIVHDVDMCIGGMRGGNYHYQGDIDEVRISNVARSAAWLKLQHATQAPMQTAVGHLVRPGAEFSVSSPALELKEATQALVTANAGGAQKVTWILQQDGSATTVAVDRFSYTFDAGRITADRHLALQFRAIYPDAVKTIEIPITIREAIPEPVVSLQTSAEWNGRDPLEVIPVISNREALAASGHDAVRMRFAVRGGAVIRRDLATRMVLQRSQCSGTIEVEAAVDNGGAPTIATAKIRVQEPPQDPWIAQPPLAEEQPVDHQFYARRPNGTGTLVYRGTLDRAADDVFLRLFEDGTLLTTVRQPLQENRRYTFALPLTAGQIHYRVEFGAKIDGKDTVLRTVDDLVCGDVFVIQGQSNAEACGPNNGPNVDPPLANATWIRSYGNSFTGATTGGFGNAVRTRIWGQPDYGEHQIGAWGMVLADNLVTAHQIPICILNGAVGGTRIDEHQRNEQDPRDPATIYGRLLRRLEAARLLHGVRAVLWHQGENNQGSASPTGDYDWKSYQQYFIDLAAAWKQDFPNLERYYVHQIWPSACNMGATEAGDMLLEVQRTLPNLFSKLRIQSTLGITNDSSGPGLCHFDLDGYAQLAKQLQPLLEQDFYGRDPSICLSAPNLQTARWAGPAHDAIRLEFDQPIQWRAGTGTWFLLGGKPAEVRSGNADGKVLTLQLANSAAPAATTVSYLSGKNWDGKADRLLLGTNGIAALAFSAVPIAER